MIQIGDKQVLSSHTLIIPHNEVATISVPFTDTVVTIKLIFKNPENTQPSANWSIAGNLISIEFSGWNNSLGFSMKRPQKLREINGTPIGFLLTHHLIGDTNLVHFQLLIGGVYA